MKDEDYAYGQWKQRQIDSGRLTTKPYLIIGSALPQGERVQRSVRTDPHPEIPFAERYSPISKVGFAMWVVGICSWLGAMIYWSR